MITGKPIRIVSFGKYLPAAVSSEELEAKLGIPQGWSKLNSGVNKRHQVSFETIGYMGARAAEEALEKADLNLSDIDILISAGATYDYPIPNQASVIKSEIKNSSNYLFPAFDIDTTCLSFITAFEMASRIMDGKDYKRILIVSSEIASKGLNSENFETATLFGDAAVAVVVEYAPNSESLFIKSQHRTYSEGVYNTLVEGGGAVKYFKDFPYDKELHSFKMNGKNLLKLTQKSLPAFFSDFFDDQPFTIEQTDVIIPHQASKIGLQLFKRMYSFNEHQVQETLSEYGNCIAASIPLTLALAIEKGDLKRGDICMMAGTSAGFSIGAVLIKY